MSRDGRVLRQVALGAQEGYDVTVVGWGTLDRPRRQVTMVPIRRHVFGALGRLGQGFLVAAGRLEPRLWERWYWRKPDHRSALAAVVGARPDLIHANEAIALPIAVQAKDLTGAAVLFDAHELSLDQWKGSVARRALFGPLYQYLLRRTAPRVDAMITVAPGIAALYQDALGVRCGVVRNAPPYRRMPLRPTDPERIRLVHHGVALRGRRLEDAVEVCRRLDGRFTLDLMLVPSSPGYVGELRALADRVAPGRVGFPEPVAPDDIVEAIGDRDLGLSVIPPIDQSYRLSLPNKFFEYLMAGLAVAVGPSPEMAAVCREWACGVVADDHSPAAVAAALRRLDGATITAMKSGALRAARRYNAEHEMAALAELYRRLADGRHLDGRA